MLRLVAALGALACLAARIPKLTGPDEADPSPIDYGAVGPFVGGFLLVSFAGAAALSPPAWGPVVLIVIAIVTVVAMRTFVPPISIAGRRALITPFVLVTGGLFWNLIHAVVTPGPGTSLNLAALLRAENLAALWFVAVFGALHYAMLIYAPREVAEPEGVLREWFVRYAVFPVCLLVGLAGSLIFWTESSGSASSRLVRRYRCETNAVPGQSRRRPVMFRRAATPVAHPSSPKRDPAGATSSDA